MILLDGKFEIEKVSKALVHILENVLLHNLGEREASRACENIEILVYIHLNAVEITNDYLCISSIDAPLYLLLKHNKSF